MFTPISVNELIDRLTELAGQTVCVVGSLSLEFEGNCINHIPKSERRDAVFGKHQSSVWVNFDLAAINHPIQWLDQFDRRHVKVSGTITAPEDGYDGCGHFSLWPAELMVRVIGR